jgi:predicted DNA-binding transcriptional regulator AlpA
MSNGKIWLIIIILIFILTTVECYRNGLIGHNPLLTSTHYKGDFNMKIENPENIEPDIIIVGTPCYTRPALAKALGKSEQTVAGWRTRGFGPSFILLGRKVVYPQKEVLKWLDSQIVTPGEVS